MSEHKHLRRPRTDHCSPKTVTCSVSFPYTNKGKPITAVAWLSSFGILNFALLAKQYCSVTPFFSSGFGHKLLITTLLISTYIYLYLLVSTYIYLCSYNNSSTSPSGFISYSLNSPYWNKACYGSGSMALPSIHPLRVPAGAEHAPF